MFLNIYANEFRQNLKSIPFWIFTGILFYSVYLFVSTIKPGVIFIGVGYGKEWHNAPLIIAKIFTNLSVYGALITMIMVGRTVTKDFSAKIHDFFFTLPLSKTAYLGGRFLGGATANLLIFIGVMFGFIAGCAVLEPQFYGPFRLSAYALPIAIMVIPNLLLVGSIFFSLATLSRKMTLTYIAGVIFLMIYAAAMGGFGNIKNDTFRILADPFGVQALVLLTKFWTVSELNNNTMPLNAILFLNRAIALGISFLILIYTWKKFKFVSVLEKKDKNSDQIEQPGDSKIIRSLGHISSTALNYSFIFQLTQCAHLMWREFKRIAFHPAFIILTFGAMSEILVNYLGNIAYGEYNIYPLTSWYLKYIEHIWAYIIPITILFGGMIVWWERDHHSNEFYDTLPLPDWMSYLSKLFTIMGIQFFYIVLAMLTGIITQTVFFGYTDIELGLYIKRLFGIELLNYWHLSIAVFFIQNLVPNKYLGFFLSAFYFIADFVIFEVIKLDNILFRYGYVPKYIYTNLNGFGHYAPTIIWYTIYWLLFGFMLIILTALLWRRNNEISLRFRTRNARQKMNQRYKLSLSVFLMLFLLTGGYIAYNKYILNDYLSKDDQKQLQADYEKKYSHYEAAPQPDVVDTKLTIDIYPEQRDLYIKGSYLLQNKTDQNIDEVYINLSQRNISKINKLEFSKPATLNLEETNTGFRIYQLQRSLAPDDEIDLEFNLEVHKQGFSENHPQDELTYNGTCLLFSPAESVEYFPSIGFNRSLILTDEYDRKKFDLPPRHENPKLEHADRTVCFANTNRSTFEAVVSTCQNQVVISNGDLIKKWSQGNRNYFHFQSTIPMYNEFIFASGEYTIAQEQYKDISIEIYYDQKHYYNIDRLINGVKKSLDYCSSNFAPFPYHNLRIVEIPGYMKDAAARSQPTVFIWDENHGFVTDLSNPDHVDMAFGICTHEMGHQWWAYMVMPAQAEGAFMLTETLCQYVEIMCLEQEYGLKMTRTYLEENMDRYLRNRQRDRKGERPLIRAYAGQHYINYPKSTVTMYALQDYIGEQNVNLTLKRVIEKYGNREDVFPLSVDVIEEFKKVTPDSFQYLVSDLFEKVTLYENRAISASSEALSDGRYKVNLTIATKKFYADSIGTQTEMPLNDYIYVGVFGENKKELYLKKHKFLHNESTLEILVDEKPVRAGIDPYVILIDRKREDNVIEVTGS